MLQADDFSCRARGLPAGLKGRPRTHEQAHFDPLFCSDVYHLADFFIRQKHNAASLADSVNGHSPIFGGINHLAKDARPLATGNLNTPLAAIAKSQRAGL